VNGKFSPRQREIYQIVLDAQLAGYAPWVEPIGPRELQLDRYRATAKRIEREVNKRVDLPPAKRHAFQADWRGLIDAAIGAPMPADPDERTLEEKARAEKSAALEELFSARLSVLVGPAGTGKTTLLRALCAIERVKTGGVLLLAPTGKARVQLMKSAAGLETRTLAQSLLASKRYDPLTGAYRLRDVPATTKAYKTVIIDECSMLTEEALAATLEDLAGVERLILVGDPRQLPPIGAGRPFVDLVARLRPDVVVMDAAMPGLNGFQAERRIRQVAPETRLPALSAHSDDHYVAQMIRVVAAGFVAKQETGRVLPRANLRVAAGGTYFSPLIERRLRRLRALARTCGALAEVVAPEPTPREAEVLQRIAEGSADKLIAAALGVSIKTVENRQIGRASCRERVLHTV
jgi:DNA-binding NarL/FixJ family response regulator